MNRFLIKTANFVHVYYKYILVISAIVAVLFASFIFRIEIKSDMMDVMPSDNPSMKLFAETLNEFQRINALTIVVNSGNERIERHTEFIEQLAQRITESSLIRDVDYSFFHLPWEFFSRNFPLYLDEKGLALLEQKLSAEGIESQIKRNYRSLASMLSSPADAGIISEDPLDIRSLFKNSTIRETPEGMDTGSGYYFSKDHTKAFIFVTPDGSGRDFSFVRRLKEEMDSIADRTLKDYEAQNNLTVEFTGGYAISWEARGSIRRDMLFSILITVFLVLAIFRLIYRGRFTGLFVIFLTILMALIITLTSAFILFRGLNLVTALVSSMLIGLGFDYTIHIFDRYMMEFNKNGDSLKALETTFANTGRSIITSAITTAFAFFSIIVTSFKGLHELGIIAGIGIIACMISSIIILGSLLTWLSIRKSEKLLLHGDNQILEQVLPDFIFKYSKLFLVTIGVTVIILSSGIFKLKFDSDISKIGPKHSRALELQKDLFEQTGKKGIPLILTYKGKDNFDKIFNDMDRTLAEWSERQVIGDHISLSSIIPPPYRQQRIIQRLQENFNNPHKIINVFLSALARNNFKIEDKNTSYIKNISNSLRINKPLAIDELPESVRSKADMFYNRGNGRIAAYTYPAYEQWDEAHIAALKEDLKSMDEGWQLTGWPLLQNDLKKSIVRESLNAVLLSFIFILLVLYFHFRKAAVIFLVQLPLLFGIVCTLGIMGHANISFNYINISAIAMIFGISVDYGVYFMQSFLEKGAPEDQKLVRHAFKNIVICSLTTMAGFGSLILTNFRGISSLGQVIIIGILSCVVISAALLPMSERLLKHSR
ncbi:MAG TPA: hypothetical protein ENH82_08815 [bacterium]|nr:hypothetical protein [bacterium]